MPTPVQCPNGHFYDSERYSTCPHCANAGMDQNPTVSMPRFEFGGAGDIIDETVPIGNGGALDVDFPTVSSPASAGGYPADDGDDDIETVGYFEVPETVPAPQNIVIGETVPVSKRTHYDPVVGWLICASGKLKGCDFRLKSGKNFIGRDGTNDVCLDGEMKVSRKRHAAVIYDPKQNCFLAQPGESRELFYLNGELVVSACGMKRGDRLEVGDVTLVFIPLCDEDFRWDAPAE